MDVWSITLILFGGMIFLLALGQPIFSAIGGIAVIGTALLWSWQGLYNIPLSFMKSFPDVLLALPFFLLMANLLGSSGIADDLYQSIYLWAGGLNGGLAIGTIAICAIMGAMSGISGAGTMTIGLLALPSMFQRNYHKDIALGCIAAGGVLAIVIPPSISMIILATVARLSVGKLFFGGLIPGLVTAALHMVYIGIRCGINPRLGPALPLEERAEVSLRDKMKSLKGLVLPLIIIAFVLGSIYTGAATPTEAAAIGAAGAFFSGVIHRRLNWKLFYDATRKTTLVTCMALWICGLAGSFNAVYIAMGAQDLITKIVVTLSAYPTLVIALMMFSVLVLGCFMDDFAIIILCVPIFMPIVVALGYDPLWFGVLFVVNIQTAFLTPPFGYNLFYLRGIVPKGVTMTDVYRSVIPFVAIQLVTVVLCIVFPQLILWLPNLMI